MLKSGWIPSVFACLSPFIYFSRCSAASRSRAARAADEPDLYFQTIETAFKLLTPNDKLATYGLTIPTSRASPAISPFPSAAA